MGTNEGSERGSGPSEVLLRTTPLLACRIALNYMPIWFGAFFALAALTMALDLTGSSVWLAALFVTPFVVLVLWLRRCALIRTAAGDAVIVNPIHRVTLRPEDVERIRSRAFRLGKDGYPLLITHRGERIPFVVGTGKFLDLAEWQDLFGLEHTDRAERRAALKATSENILLAALFGWTTLGRRRRPR